MTHRHVYHGPSPAQIEDGDWARRCRECGWVERAIVLPYIPPGTNSLHGHRHAATSWRNQVKGDTMRLAEKLDPIEHAVITVEFRWRSHHRRDCDNFLAGCKGIFDGLVERGWIRDDDAAHVEYVVRGHYGAERDEVCISVEPC